MHYIARIDCFLFLICLSVVCLCVNGEQQLNCFNKFFRAKAAFIRMVYGIDVYPQC